MHTQVCLVTSSSDTEQQANERAPQYWPTKKTASVSKNCGYLWQMPRFLCLTEYKHVLKETQSPTVRPSATRNFQTQLEEVRRHTFLPSLSWLSHICLTSRFRQDTEVHERSPGLKPIQAYGLLSWRKAAVLIVCLKKKTASTSTVHHHHPPSPFFSHSLLNCLQESSHLSTASRFTLLTEGQENSTLTLKNVTVLKTLTTF